LIPGDEKEYSAKIQSKKKLLDALHICSTPMGMNAKTVKEIETYKHLEITKFSTSRF